MVKKRILIAMLAALFLAGCGKTETMETVADEMDVPVLAQPRKISVELPGQAEAALETDAGQLYVTDDYEIALETLDGGDLNGTLQALSGRTAEELTVLETRTEDGMKRYEFVWACAGWLTATHDTSTSARHNFNEIIACFAGLDTVKQPSCICKTMYNCDLHFSAI